MRIPTQCIDCIEYIDNAYSHHPSRRQQHPIFTYISECLDESPSPDASSASSQTDMHAAVLAHIASLTRIDAGATAWLMTACMPAEHDAVLTALEGLPELQYAYLKVTEEGDAVLTVAGQWCARFCVFISGLLLLGITQLVVVVD